LRPRNRQMELPVSRLVRGLVVHVFAHRAQRGEEQVEVGILALGRSERRDSAGSWGWSLAVSRQTLKRDDEAGM